MSQGRFFATALALFMTACGGTAGEKGREMDDGAILYMPAPDPGIHQDGHEFQFAFRLVDDATGYILTRNGIATLDGIDGRFDQWRLDGRRAGKPDVYFLTRDRQGPVPGTPAGVQVMEIAYAKTDGYLPLEDALYPADMSFERIAGMLNIYGSKRDRVARVYLDNRIPNRLKYEQWASARMREPYLPANFERSPLDSEHARLYLPAANSAVYDPATKTATAADGSRLHSDNVLWSTNLDRDGRRQRIYATWSDIASSRQRQIVMAPLRGYRKGYGETRVVGIFIEAWPRKRGMFDATTPDGKMLADLINVTVPIAGEHAGHLIVIDSRSDPREMW